MTNTWQDIKNANVILVMGGNAAEAHPCGFKWVTEAKQHNHAKLVVVDPRFTRTAAVADLYAPIRPGTDIAFLNGVMRYLLEKDAIQREYVLAFTNASLIVKEGFGFQDGLFSGFSPEKKDYDRVKLGLRVRRGRLRQVRPDAGRSALRLQPAEAARRRATRRRWCRASAARRWTSSSPSAS